MIGQWTKEVTKKSKFYQSFKIKLLLELWYTYNLGFYRDIWNSRRFPGINFLI